MIQNQSHRKGHLTLLHQRTAEHTFFSRPHGTVTKIDHILGHKTDLTNLKEWIIYCIFSAHNGFKLKISNRKINEKSQNTRSLNTHFQITHG